MDSGTNTNAIHMQLQHLKLINAVAKQMCDMDLGNAHALQLQLRIATFEIAKRGRQKKYATWTWGTERQKAGEPVRG